MTISEKVVKEVNRLPDEQLEGVFNLIDHFRLGLEANRSKPDIMSFSGSWKDMTEAEFEDFLDEMKTRRRNTSRRERHAVDTV